MKIPTNQLTLNLTFNDPTPAVLLTLATLVEIADASNMAGATADLPIYDGQASDTANPHAIPDQTALRKTLRQLVGCIAITHKLEWHTVWVLAYHRFFKLTGKHPVSESVRVGLPSHLDYVFTDPSWPGQLQNILDDMLTSTTPL